MTLVFIKIVFINVELFKACLAELFKVQLNLWIKALALNRVRKIHLSTHIYQIKLGKGEWKFPYAFLG